MSPEEVEKGNWYMQRLLFIDSHWILSDFLGRHQDALTALLGRVILRRLGKRLTGCYTAFCELCEVLGGLYGASWSSK